MGASLRVYRTHSMQHIHGSSVTSTAKWQASSKLPKHTSCTNTHVHPALHALGYTRNPHAHLQTQNKSTLNAQCWQDSLPDLEHHGRLARNACCLKSGCWHRCALGRGQGLTRRVVTLAWVVSCGDTSGQPHAWTSSDSQVQTAHHMQYLCCHKSTAYLHVRILHGDVRRSTCLHAMKRIVTL